MLALLITTATAAPLTGPQDAQGGFAIYCPRTCGELSVEGIVVKNRLPGSADVPTMAIERWSEGFELPDAEHLQTWGEGEVSGVASAGEVLVVTWVGPREGAAARVAQIGQAALSIGTWFEDLDTSMVYDAASFEHAISGFSGPTPDITGLTLLEGAQSRQKTRLVMHGLGKVGLPSLVMEDIPPGEENASAIALSVTAQTLYERGLSEELVISADQLAAQRVAQTACGISGTVSLTSVEPGREDPVGALTAVAFTGGFSDCGAEAVAETPAPEEAVAPPAPPQTLEEAQDAALAQLNGPIRDSFAQGLPPGSTLMVKAPFQGTRRSVEWLWLRVEQWRTDGTLIGELLSQPSRVMTLSKGDQVAVQLDQVFDYVLVKPDGTREGNTTAQFLR